MTCPIAVLDDKFKTIWIGLAPYGPIPPDLGSFGLASAGLGSVGLVCSGMGLGCAHKTQKKKNVQDPRPQKSVFIQKMFKLLVCFVRCLASLFGFVYLMSRLCVLIQ